MLALHILLGISPGALLPWLKKALCFVTTCLNLSKLETEGECKTEGISQLQSHRLDLMSKQYKQA